MEKSYDYIRQWLDTRMLYQVMQRNDAQLIDLGGYNTQTLTPGTPTSPTSGSGAIMYTPIDTNPDTALVVYAIGMSLYDGVVFGNLPSGGGASQTYGVTVALTYTQPSPPASNTTTLASTTGNLKLRNRFWELSAFQNLAEDNYGSATSGITSFMPNVTKEITVEFAQPIMLVGSQLAVAWESPSWDGGNQFTVRAMVVGKYVHINSATYVKLVALATGQAILPPSILG